MGFVATNATAQSPGYSVDPYAYRVPPGASSSYAYSPQWQIDPFNVGYDLLLGYRPIYSGARQPIGHEIISTHNGNGYIYRPTYAPSPGYHYTPGGALVIEYRGTYSPPQTVVPYSPPVYSEPLTASPTAREF